MKFISLFLVTIAITMVFMLGVKASKQLDRPPASTYIDEEAETSAEMQHFTGALTLAQDLPFSEAVLAGEMLYLSGMLGTVPGTRKLAPGGIRAETKQVMDNMRRILESNNSALNRVVKCTVILADINEWAAMNEVYATYFEKGRFPARTAFGSNGLLLGARVEIECLALTKSESVGRLD